MARSVATWAAVLLAGGMCVAPVAARAQKWNDGPTRALVERATEHRARTLADTALRDYRATAHGYLTFLAQLGEGFTEPPKVVKADELALEVYWRAPNLSKQRIIGRRDTLVLPTDIQYHRDHLGIVQNNFPNIIRIGDGDEVADVPHPLSPAGLQAYDFAIRDSLALRLPDRTINVYEVLVRPRDPDQARLIGSIYIDRETGEVARMAFNFTHAALLDRQLEDLFITLENALVAGRFWLPRRQEVEIRRSGTWLDYPVRGIIRGRWEICCYDVNVGLERALFAGPEIVMAPPRVRESYPWTGRILDSLPQDVRLAADEDVRRVQAEARELVKQQALSGVTGAALSARRLSDFVRVNRVEGLALGAGARVLLGGGFRADAGGRYGLSDEAVKGGLSLSWERASGLGVKLFASREMRDAGDVQEVSLVRNSMAAQEFGSDYTDPYDVRSAGVALSLGRVLGTYITLDGARERQGRLAIHASPSFGAYEPVIDAWSLDGTSLRLAARQPSRAGPAGSTVRGRAELRVLRYDGRDTVLSGGARTLWRGTLELQTERRSGSGKDRLVLRTFAGAVSAPGVTPPQALIYLGGPVTAPGYEFHSMAAELAFSQRLEWRRSVPAPSLPLGGFGSTPAQITVAPYASAAWLGRPASSPDNGAAGWYPSLGMGAYLFFDLLRLDVARGLRDGRWSFSIDVSGDFWDVL
jgi:hypothetical protein